MGFFTLVSRYFTFFMKKAVVILFAVLLSAISVKAQSFINYGFKVGGLNTWILNSRILTGNADTSYKFSFGYTAGANFGYFFNKRTYYSHKLKGIELSVNYTAITQGYSLKSPVLLASNRSVSLGYVDIGLSFALFPIADNGFYFLFGPQYSILVNAKAKGDAIKDLNGIIVSPSYSGRDVKSSFSGGSIQVAMELGRYFNSRSNSHLAFKAGAKFGYGFNDITKPSRVDGLPYFKNNPAYIGLVFGILFSAENYYN